tara:strand:+ start:180 stop:824 length:645 start_codon:yes stop_codon:yes gene_type:complete
MTNLLQNEQAFLEGNSTLNFNRIRTLTTQLTEGKKKKFDISLKLSEYVKGTKEYFESTEGKDALLEEGITWTTETMFIKIFGWKKSYCYKLIKLAKLKEENSSVISNWKRECTRLEGEGENVSRSVENCLKYAKEEENSSESGETPSVTTRPPVLLEVKMQGKKAKISGENESPIFKTDMSLSEVEQLIVYATRLKDYLATIAEQNSSEGLPFE